ncbi:NADH-quinone oxidoreductase subunit H [bacterium]|nr:NADH-quinone oxidoreductase subunit H [bacterium]
MSDWYVWISLLKALILIGLILQVVPGMLFIERRGSAWMQNRLGPNRLGPFGIFQGIADAVKLIFKEDFIPEHVHKLFFGLSPFVSMLPSLITFAVIPFAAPILINGETLTFQVADLDVGILFTLAIVSLGVYGVMMGGWASNSKYAMLGALRSSSQLISYELSMGLAVVSMLMVYSHITLTPMVEFQGQALFTIAGITVPKWGFLLQPVAFIIFFTCTYAETNRLPFDLPEGESEIIAGYHLEFGSMKFASYMLAEYSNMLTAAGLTVTLFFGGYQLLPGMSWLLHSLGLSGMTYEWVRVAFQATAFLIKVGFFMWTFVWIRWTLPRFRFDQVMDLGWKIMLPLALLNVFVTALLIAGGVY